MIFFAIFIVNSFLNSSLGYVGLWSSGSSGFNSDISSLNGGFGDISLSFSSGSWLGGSWLGGSSSWLFSSSGFLSRGHTLLCFIKRNSLWVWEWLWVSEIGGVGLNLNLSGGVRSDIGSLNGDSGDISLSFSSGSWLGGSSSWGLSLLNWDISLNTILKWNKGWIWEWLGVSEIGSVCLNSSVGSFLVLGLLPLSGGLGEVGITLGNFIDLNISLNVFLLWWAVHKGSGLSDVGVLIIINTGVLWVGASNVVLVIHVKSVVGFLADLRELFNLLSLVLRYWSWSELSGFRVDMTIIIHRGGS
jgi:hypothetical protein